ncbi:FAD-binding domain-containing protein [Sphingomonas sp. HT-1]|uniref:FAD-binding domain-containing protein n=2 Tax=Sphingomonas TaxID=13687 RepID=UPI0002DF1A4D|nr:deoxyribodipyrimidine photolyase [Sphingomonas sp. WG]
MLLQTSGDRASVLSFDFPLSRSAALARLEAFLPMAGRSYAERRNEVAASGQHGAVSRLSAALRRRLIGEDEVAAAVIAAHGREGAAAFLRELTWRTYWKGWLEQHPFVWESWKATVQSFHDGGLPAGYRDAVAGTTGIDAFDAWVAELRATGYLHNWARMQVASIWIFTLGLPWELGADFLYRQLIDADPASNTLSWRWVAGLHTQDKAYLANAEHIRRQTGGRFNPRGLAQEARVPRETPMPPAQLPRTITAPNIEKPTLLLLTAEDLSLDVQPATQPLAVRRIVACRSLCNGPADIAATADGLQRAQERWGAPSAWVASLQDVVAQAAAEALPQIVTGYAPVGPIADALADARREGLAVAEHLRDWDAQAWPHCKRGYFHFAKQASTLLASE